MTALTARSVRCPAVMTSELVALSAQMVAVPPASERVAAPPAEPLALPAFSPVWRSALGVGRGLGALIAFEQFAHGRARTRSIARELFLESAGQILRVGESQVAHLRGRAGIDRCIQMRCQRFDLQPQRGIAAHQNAVGAVIGNDLDTVAASPVCANSVVSARAVSAAVAFCSGMTSMSELPT